MELELDEKITRDEIKHRLRQYGRTGLHIAEDLLAIHEKSLFKAWGFKRFGDWLEADADGNLSRTQAYRLVLVAKVMRKEWDRVVDAVTSGTTGFCKLVDLAGLVEKGKIGREEAVGHALAGTFPEAHAADKTELRAAPAIPQELHTLWEQAKNVARFWLDEDNPSDETILEWMISLARDQAGDHQHTTQDGVVLVFKAEDVLEGKVRCEECGSWNKSAMDPHHVRPKSKGQSSGQTRIALLCRPCHQKIQPRWREWAKAHGYDEEIQPSPISSSPPQTQATDADDWLSAY